MVGVDVAILIGWAIAGGSPGPATLAISGASMQYGRKPGVLLASGVLLGSMSWGIAAALGMGAVMMSHAWLFEAIRYLGAGYLLFLAVKSLKSALGVQKNTAADFSVKNGAFFKRGLFVHLTNPKAILSWGAIYSIALPADASVFDVWQAFFALVLVSAVVFIGYAVLFSSAPIARGYLRLRRMFELLFAILFGAVSAKILMADLPSGS
ncbi:MAG: LysE family transporter [Halocynthiibacter sp.]